MSKTIKIRPPVNPDFYIDDGKGGVVFKPMRPEIPDPSRNPLRPEMPPSLPPVIPGHEKGQTGKETNGSSDKGLRVPTKEDLERAMVGSNGLLSELTQFTAYVDINKAYAKGKENAENEVSVVQREQSNNITVMKTMALNCKETALASLNAIVICAQFVAANKSPGGLEKAIIDTSFFYNLSLLLDKKIKSMMKTDEEDSKSQQEKEDPDKAAIKYFNEQELKHRATKEAKKTQMTWVMTLLDDAQRQMSNESNSDWDRKFWTKVHQLAMGIRDDVRKESAEALNTDLKTWHLSSWWLLLPIGISATIIIAIRIFTR